MSTSQSRDNSIVEQLSKGLEIERQLLELAPLFLSRIKDEEHAKALEGYQERVARNIPKLEAILRQLGAGLERLALDEEYYGSLSELRRVVSGEPQEGNDRPIIRPLLDIENHRVTTSNWPVMIFKLTKSRPGYISVLKPMVDEAVKLREELERFDGKMMTPQELENWRISLVRSGMAPPKPGDESILRLGEDDSFPIC